MATEATFEFLSLHCVKPTERFGDEVAILIANTQVYPEPPKKWVRFHGGQALVNPEVKLPIEVQRSLRGAKREGPGDYMGVQDLLRHHIDQHGLWIEFREIDLFTKNDVIGKLLISPEPGPPVMRELTGAGGLYRFWYRVSI